MLKVKKECCKQCLFGKNKIVSDERKRQILSETKMKDKHFACHEATKEGEDHVCRGFYNKRSTNLSESLQDLMLLNMLTKKK